MRMRLPRAAQSMCSVVLVKCHFVSASQFSYWHGVRCFSTDVCHGRTPSPRPRQGQEGDHGRPLQAPGPLFLRPPRAGGSAPPLSPPPPHLDLPPGTNTLHRRRSVSGAVPERPLLPLGRGSPGAADLTLGVGPAVDAACPTRGPLGPCLSLRRSAADAACPTRGPLGPHLSLRRSAADAACSTRGPLGPHLSLRRPAADPACSTRGPFGPRLSLRRRWPCRHAVRHPAAGAGAISRRPLGSREPRRPVSRRPGASGPPAWPLGPRRSCSSPPAAPLQASASLFSAPTQSLTPQGLPPFAPPTATTWLPTVPSAATASGALPSHLTPHLSAIAQRAAQLAVAQALSPLHAAPTPQLPPSLQSVGLPPAPTGATATSTTVAGSALQAPLPSSSTGIPTYQAPAASVGSILSLQAQLLSHLLLHSSPPSSWLLSTPLSLPSPVSLLQPLPEVSS